jgi:hypothetical protein
LAFKKLTSAEQSPSVTSAEDALDVDSKFSLPYLLDFHFDVSVHKRGGLHAPMLQISLLALHVCASRKILGVIRCLVYGPLNYLLGPVGR